MKLIGSVLLACICFQSLGGGLAAAESSIRMRARENYEMLQIDTKQGRFVAKSLSHTINLWQESPRKWALGLGLGPFVMVYKKTSLEEVSAFKETAKVFHALIESKIWVLPELFLRIGVGGLFVDTLQPEGKDVGYESLFATGYEYDWDGIGIAVELGQRQGRTRDKNYNLHAPYFALGVHFYRFI